jgi:hypothetical protein
MPVAVLTDSDAGSDAGPRDGGIDAGPDDGGLPDSGLNHDGGLPDSGPGPCTEGTRCDAGFCHDGACRLGCSTDGGFFTPMSDDAGICEICDPAIDDTALTGLPDYSRCQTTDGMAGQCFSYNMTAGPSGTGCFCSTSLCPFDISGSGAQAGCCGGLTCRGGWCCGPGSSVSQYCPDGG